MKNRLKTAAAGLILALIFASCQQVFTTSAFSFVETDISTMTAEQQVSYAEDLLLAGPPADSEAQEAYYAELQAAYDAVYAQLPSDLSTADPDTLVLAADLAIGASGVGGAVTNALEVFTSGGEASGDSITSIIGSIDTDNLADAVTLIEAAEDNGVPLTTEQYTNAAAAQVLVVLDQVADLGVADPSSLNDADPVQAAIIDDLEQALGWAEAGGVDLSMFGDGIALP